MKKIIVTGANGQVGQEFQLSAHKDKYQFYFFTREELDILSFPLLERAFQEIRPDFVINLAAYTDVEKAEKEEETAYLVNVIGTKNLATLCKLHKAVLVHLSTDYVFDGEKLGSYEENDPTIPINVYGKTKQLAEKEIANSKCKHVILRIAWVYSNFAKNFYLTMLQLSQKTSEINVVDDQWGSPTSAKEVCRAIDAILFTGVTLRNSGIYHFSPVGKTCWKDFAIEIFKQAQIPVLVNGVPAKAYPTAAKRPKNSCMSSQKFIHVFGFTPMHWKNALAEVISEKRISPVKVGYLSILGGKEYVIASVDWAKKEVVLALLSDMRKTICTDFEKLYE